MNREEILKTISNLAKSQGLYGRLLRNIKALESNDPEQYENVMRDLEEAKFKDAVELVMYIES